MEGYTAVTLESSKQPSIPQPKTCATCAHLVGRRHQTEFHEGWICGAPENIESKSVNLVTGLETVDYRFRQCIVARRDEWNASINGGKTLRSCGQEGVWWKLYEEPEYYSKKFASRAPGKVSADDLLKELES